jgi:outer membrane protein OmpA-like peptidoglycan-associated protein
MALLVGDGWQLVTAGRFRVLAASGPAQQQQQQTSGKTVEPANQTAASPTGGTTTGLFTTLSGRTLRRSEFTLGFSWNNFDRDPGDLDITQVPVSLTFGLTNRLEMFASLTVFQQVTSRQPFALSGYQFNGVRSAFGGDPFVAFGAPSGELNGAGVFPFTGAALGGILPPLGSFFGPAIITDRPGFYNELPFFGPASFSGGGFNLRRSANGTGDVTLGLKYAITDPDSRFNMAAAAFVRVPTAKNFHALANGRGAGVTDYGIMFISGQNYAGNRVRFVQNLGYVHSGDPERNGVKLVNRRDQLLANIGVELSPAQQLVLTGEWANTIYVGQGTPSLNSINPSDLLLGARFFGWDGRIQLGGAWRRLLNQSNNRTVPVFVPGQGVRSLEIGSGDPNGFVFNLSVARRASLIPPPAPNRAPTVALLVDRTDVREGDQVRIEARAVDPDNDVVTYSWSVEPRTVPPTLLRAEGLPAGAPLGDKIVADTRGVNPTPGSLPVTVTITVTVDDGRGATATDSRTITVASQPAAPPTPTPVTPTPPPTPPPQPPPNRAPAIQSIEISPIGTPRVTGQITDGDLLRIRAVAADPDGDVLVYRWTSSAGRRTGIGSEITLDTTGVTPAPGQTPVALTVTLTVDDGRGGTDSDSRTINVVPARRPEAITQPMLIFTSANVARITNVHKAVLDKVVETLKQDPRATLVVDGHQDRGERSGVARTRARNAAAYMVTPRGIDRSRITVRNFGATRPHPSGQTRLNRRVEMWLVPVGAELPPNHAVPRERIPSAAQQQRQLRQQQQQQLQQPQQQQTRPPQPQPQPPRPQPQQPQQQQQSKPQPQQQKPPQPQQQAKPPQQQPKPQTQQQKPPQPTTQQQQKKPSPPPQKKPQSQQPQQPQPQQKQQPKPEPKKPQTPASSPAPIKKDDAADEKLVAAHQRRGLRVNSVPDEASPLTDSTGSQISKRGVKSPSRSTKKSPRQIARR